MNITCYGDSDAYGFDLVVRHCVGLLAEREDVPPDLEILLLPVDDELMWELGILPRGTTAAGATFLPPDMSDSTDNSTFCIAFNTGLGLGEAIITLAHECIHVAQYLSGDLRTVWEGESMVSRWKGTRVDESLVEYDDLPWEVEAYALQDEVVDSLLEQPDLLARLGVHMRAA